MLEATTQSLFTDLSAEVYTPERAAIFAAVEGR